MFCLQPASLHFRLVFRSDLSFPAVCISNPDAVSGRHRNNPTAHVRACVRAKDTPPNVSASRANYHTFYLSALLIKIPRHEMTKSKSKFELSVSLPLSGKRNTARHFDLNDSGRFIERTKIKHEVKNIEQDCNYPFLRTAKARRSARIPQTLI